MKFEILNNISSQMWSKPKKERNAKILELKKEGKTNRYIGKLLGITPQMVNIVYVRETKKGPPKEHNSFRSALNGRLICGLMEYFGGVVPGPLVIANEGATKLRMANGVGPKSLQVLAKALHKYGYIEDPEQWLAGKQHK